MSDLNIPHIEELIKIHQKFITINKTDIKRLYKDNAVNEQIIKDYKELIRKRKQMLRRNNSQ